MADSLLMTRPEHDDTTFYLSSWSREVLEVAENRGLRVFDLHREKANRGEVEKKLKRFSPKLVVLNGHGDEDTVAGHKDQPLIRAGENDELLRSMIVYAISCRSAKNLGVKSVERGALSYTGYIDDFIFFYEPAQVTRPLADTTAALFLQPSQVFTESLLKGNTVAVASERTIARMKQNIIALLGDVSTARLAGFLWWDMKNIVSHGRTDASL